MQSIRRLGYHSAVKFAYFTCPRRSIWLRTGSWLRRRSLALRSRFFKRVAKVLSSRANIASHHGNVFLRFHLLRHLSSLSFARPSFQMDCQKSYIGFDQFAVCPCSCLAVILSARTSSPCALRPSARRAGLPTCGASPLSLFRSPSHASGSDFPHVKAG